MASHDGAPFAPGARVGLHGTVPDPSEWPARDRRARLQALERLGRYARSGRGAAAAVAFGASLERLVHAPCAEIGYGLAARPRHPARRSCPRNT